MASKVNRCNKKSKETEEEPWEYVEECDDEFEETESYFTDPQITDTDGLNTNSGTEESPKKEEKKKKKKKKIRSMKKEVRRLGLWYRYTEVNYEDGERLIMYDERSSPPEDFALIMFGLLYLFLTCFFVYGIAPLMDRGYSKSD